MKQTNSNKMRVRGKMSKQNIRFIFPIVFLCITLVLGISVHYILDYPESYNIKADKKVGESTIVTELQTAVDSIMLAEMEMLDMLQGQAIVMKVKTGEILAMVGRERDFEGVFLPCKNFAYQQEFGSLAKTASLLVALETGKVTLDDVVDTKDGVWIIDDDRTLRDHNWRRGGYGLMTLERALEVSSNIGITKTIWNLFKGHEQDYFNKLDSMNYGKPDSIVGIENLSPTSYHTPKDSDWINKDIIWSSIGYNRKMAAIQMLTFYNAIANNGKMVKPTLQPGITKVINEQIASRKNIESIQQALEHVVSQGLGKLAGSKRIKVAGKTGTTHVKEYYEGDNTVSEYHLAFCGYYPADKPKYSMIVSLNKLGLPASGGAMAGEAFHNIVEWMIDNEMIK